MVKVGCMAVMMCMVMVAVMMILSVSVSVEGAITCGQVAGSVGPCVEYLKKGGAVGVGCCNGVRSLKSAATTPADRKTACGCLKSIAGSIPGLNWGFASTLPSKCGVTIPYKISPSTDCSKVN